MRALSTTRNSGLEERLQQLEIAKALKADPVPSSGYFAHDTPYKTDSTADVAIRKAFGIEGDEDE